jgi:hypothetical protein
MFSYYFDVQVFDDDDGIEVGKWSPNSKEVLQDHEEMLAAAMAGDDAGDGAGDGVVDLSPEEEAAAERAFRESHGYYSDEESRDDDGAGGLEIEGAVVEHDGLNILAQQKAAATLQSAREEVEEGEAVPLTEEEAEEAEAEAEEEAEVEHEAEITVPLSTFAGTEGLDTEPLFGAEEAAGTADKEEGEVEEGEVEEGAAPVVDEQEIAAELLEEEEEGVEAFLKGYTDDDDAGWNMEDGLTAEEEAAMGRIRKRGRKNRRKNRRRLTSGRRTGETIEAAIRRRLAADDFDETEVSGRPKAGVWMVTCSFEDSSNRGCYNSHGGVDDMGTGNTLASCHAGCVELEKKVTDHQPW